MRIDNMQNFYDILKGISEYSKLWNITIYSKPIWSYMMKRKESRQKISKKNVPICRLVQCLKRNFLQENRQISLQEEGLLYIHPVQVVRKNQLYCRKKILFIL